MLGMLNWDGFSEKSFQTKQSSLRKMRVEGLQLNPAISLFENTKAGLGPRFQKEGFVKPETIMLFDQGSLASTMISLRTGRETGLMPAKR
jgi:hypothetical protein